MARLTIEVTDEQHQHIKARAAIQGKSIKDYALDRLLDPTADDEKAFLELKALNRRPRCFRYGGTVVFLDWYVKRQPGARGADIWVLNPKELRGWIRQERDCLSEADVAMATLHLKQFVKHLAA